MARMIMGLLIGYGHGPRGWDDPGLRSNYDWRQPEVYQDLELVCERGIFDVRAVEKLLQLHTRGRDLDLQLWTMLSFELWCRRFMDATEVGKPFPSTDRARRRPAQMGGDAPICAPA